MIGVVFQAYRVLEDGTLIPHGSFYSSFSDAFEVVRGLREQGLKALVRVIIPFYSI